MKVIKCKAKVTPLFVSASSWIVITPNVFNPKLQDDNPYGTPYKKSGPKVKSLRLNN